MSNKQKLELTWIGKNNPEYDITNIEPRILEEKRELSYGEPNMDNMIIHGDNLLALRALLPEYEGSVKCIYIDPPFNTGNAFDHYDDSVEHSTWLSLMKPRLELLRKLLKKDGAIFIHLDDNELDYLKIMMDEVFNRKNFINRITIDARSPSAFSTVNPGVFKASEYILWYARDKAVFSENPVRVPRNPDRAYSKWLENPNDPPEKWEFKSLADVYSQIPPPKSKKPEALLEHFNQFVIKNAQRVFRYTAISDTGAGQAVIEMKKTSIKSPGKVFTVERKNLDPVRIINGQQISFYSKNVTTIDGVLCASQPLTNVWTDIAWEGIANEGGVQFKKGKKPEKLLRRCIELVSSPGDLVLDSFAGSGTTAAVAHKMGRKWITCELGEHCHTHVIPRLKAVIDGDQGGISKAVNWQGGGGFKFFELAPSFVTIDEFGNPVIDSHYNDTKLIRAMCKLMNYTFAPNPKEYWKQGKGQGNNSIYVTTQMLSVGMVRQIAVHLGVNDTLLICPKKYEPGCEKVDSRIIIKKIPHSILKACHFGKREYLLPIKETTIEELDAEESVEDEE